jgi:uncharacterized membrane protein YozB (DUF420 family)
MIASVRALIVSVTIAVMVVMVGAPSVVRAHEGHGDHRHDGAASVARTVWHPVTFAGWVLTGMVLAGLIVVIGYVVVNLQRRRVAMLRRH